MGLADPELEIIISLLVLEVQSVLRVLPAQTASGQSGVYCIAQCRGSHATNSGVRYSRFNRNHQGTKNMLSILWTILIGFIAGVIAKFVTPGGTHEPQGFILTAALGIVGALVATYLGQAIGWYQAGQGAGFIASIVGAVLVIDLPH